MVLITCFRILRSMPVVFSPDNDPHDEKQRIADLLHDKMLELAE